LKMKNIWLTPVLAVLCLAASVSHAQERSRSLLRFETYTADSLSLTGRFFPAPVGDRPAALLLHGRTRGVNQFMRLAERLQRQGVPVVIPDLRGEGGSVRLLGREIEPAEQWGGKERLILRRDLDHVMDFVLRQTGIPGRDWFIVAEGEACAVAAELLAEDERFKRLVLLSPLLQEDFRLETLEKAEAVFLVASTGDEPAGCDLERIAALLPDDVLRKALPAGRSRGQSILRWEPGLLEDIAIWASP